MPPATIEQGHCRYAHGETRGAAGRDTLLHQAQWLSEERERLVEPIAARRQHLLRLGESAGKGRRIVETSADYRPVPVFTDPIDQLRYEVYLEWVMRFRAEETTATARGVDGQHRMLIVVAPEVRLLQVVR